MPARVYEGDLTVPAGTPAGNPVTLVVRMPAGTLRKVTLVVPSGHSGLTGFQLRWGGTPVVPYAGAGWIVADNYTDSWQLDQEQQPGSIALAGYNTDIWPHTFYCRMLWEPAAAPPAVTVVTAPGGLSAVTDALSGLAAAVQPPPAPALPAAARAAAPGLTA